MPFASTRVIRGAGDAPYIVGAMFTADYGEKAKRLISSCEKFGQPFEIHETPTVHRSVSVSGGDDLRFTKANFIGNLMREHDKPVLYLDADCEFMDKPNLICDLVKSGCDFAIYNWLADDYTDRFVPFISGHDDELDKPYRYFKYHGSVDLHSTKQLIGAGWSQFYRNSFAATALLARWHQSVAEFNGCADDDCLDFTFNNLRRSDWLTWVLKYRWLPKEYSRGMFWIYAKPVINHPDIPAPTSRFPAIKCARGRKRLYRSLVEKRRGQLLFPREAIIDTATATICKLIDGQIVPIQKTDQQFWV